MRISRLEKFRRDVGGVIDKGFRDSGTDRAYIAERTGIQYKTLCRKVRDPCEMKLGELMRITDAMGLQLNITMGSMKDEGKRHR